MTTEEKKEFDTIECAYCKTPIILSEPFEEMDYICDKCSLAEEVPFVSYIEEMGL